MTELLRLADLLDQWADLIPCWSSQDSERWDIFAERRYEAERALRARLRRLPTCTISTDPAITQVEFALAGICVEGWPSLNGACRAWAAKARLQAEA